MAAVSRKDGSAYHESSAAIRNPPLGYGGNRSAEGVIVALLRGFPGLRVGHASSPEGVLQTVVRLMTGVFVE